MKMFGRFMQYVRRQLTLQIKMRRGGYPFTLYNGLSAKIFIANNRVLPIREQVKKEILKHDDERLRKHIVVQVNLNGNLTYLLSSSYYSAPQILNMLENEPINCNYFEGLCTIIFDGEVYTIGEVSGILLSQDIMLKRNPKIRALLDQTRFGGRQK